MGLPAEKFVMDRAAFLDWEAGQTEAKHEFWQGDVFAMTGARQSHVIVAGNCFALLKNHLRGTPCRAYIADMQLEVAAADAVFYPDVFVSCSPADLAAERVAREPQVVIEVLADSTAAIDRGRKFAAYRQLPSLREYVLIDPDARTVEVFRRVKGDDWLLAAREGERALVLPSLDFEAPVAAVFEDLPQAGAADATSG